MPGGINGASAEGNPVSKAVGPDGASVGCIVGCVGTTVGKKDGIVDGAAVGHPVGRSEGVGVGAQVGTWINHDQTRSERPIDVAYGHNFCDTISFCTMQLLNYNAPASVPGDTNVALPLKR